MISLTAKTDSVPASYGACQVIQPLFAKTNVFRFPDSLSTSSGGAGNIEKSHGTLVGYERSIRSKNRNWRAELLWFDLQCRKETLRPTTCSSSGDQIEVMDHFDFALASQNRVQSTRYSSAEPATIKSSRIRQESDVGKCCHSSTNTRAGTGAGCRLRC